MKTLKSMIVTVAGTESNVELENGKLLIETKKGKLQVSCVNKHNSSLAFKAGEKEINVKFEGCAETLTALFNASKSEKVRELVIFEDFSEYLKNQSDFGAPFLVNNKDAAYKYL